MAIGDNPYYYNQYTFSNSAITMAPSYSYQPKVWWNGDLTTMQTPDLVREAAAMPAVEDPLVWLDREVNRICAKASKGIIGYREPMKIEVEAKSLPLMRCVGYTLAGERCRKVARRNAFTCDQHSTDSGDRAAEGQYVTINNKYAYVWCDDGGPPLAVGDHVVLPPGMAGGGPWTGRVTKLTGQVPHGLTPRKILSRA